MKRTPPSVVTRRAIASRLKRAMRARGMGPTLLAKALSQELGYKIIQQRVSWWLEEGTLPNDPHVTLALCGVLGIDPNYLLKGCTGGIDPQLYRALVEQNGEG